MMSKRPVEFMKKHGIQDDEIWEVRRGGTWAVKHGALERIASGLRIKFAAPVMIEHSIKDKIAVMCVTGRIEETGQEEWSIGEAAPYNNKNEYPFAMAEKRAKDRVILKLLNAAGQVYSEAEAEEFRQSEAQHDEAEAASEKWGNRRAAELKNAMRKGDPPHDENGVIWDTDGERPATPEDIEPITATLKAAYLESARTKIKKAAAADDLRTWWFSEESKKARADFDLTAMELKDLSQFCKARIDALGAK